MSNLDDRLRHALRDLDHRVAGSLAFEPSEQRTRARHRAVRILVPALAAIAVLAVLLGTGIFDGAQDNSAPATPSLVIPTVEGPSQVADDARRDKIYPVVAELPLHQRVGTLIAPAVSTPEGFWVLSHPEFTGRLVYGENGCLPQGDSAPDYELCDVDEYSELLLLSSDGRQILRAFPQPGGVSTSGLQASDWFEVTPEAVYCGHDNSGDPQDIATFCRVDRETLEFEGLVLSCEPFRNDGGCQTITDRKYATDLGLAGDWLGDVKVRGAAGVKIQSYRELQLVDAAGLPTARLVTFPKLSVEALLDE